MTTETALAQAAETEAPAVEAVEAEAPAVEAEAPAVEAEAVAEAADYTDFELPEGVDLDASALDAAKPIFKELGLDQAGAQKLVEFYASKLGEVAGTISAQAEALTAEWQGQIKQDWGAKYDANLSVAAKAVQLGGPELRDALNETGAGNHPAIIKFFHQIGSTISEDRMDGNTRTTPAAKDAREVIGSLYPTMQDKG